MVSSFPPVPAGHARLIGLIIAILLLGRMPRVATEEPSLDVVLGRSADYVAEFSKKLSGIVAEEFYVQDVRNISSRTSIGSTSAQRRELKSDFLLVRPERSDRYVEFRDVFEVDGNKVRDRDERLVQLFIRPAANADQVRAIIDESARHNLGTIPRNINTPTLPLYFLQPAQQPRFRFKRARRRTPDLAGVDTPKAGQATFRVTTETWVIEFNEKDRATIIRTNEGRDFPAAGRFWIDPGTGAVLMTELVMDRPEVNAVIDVSYESEPLLGFRVPIEMRERYTTRNERIEGVARYGHFRQFRVLTNEDIAPPVLPGEKPRKPPPVRERGRGIQ